MSNVALLVRSYVPALRTLKLCQVIQDQMNANLLSTKYAVRSPNDELLAFIVRAKYAVVFVDWGHSRELYALFLTEIGVPRSASLYKFDLFGHHVHGRTATVGHYVPDSVVLTRQRQ
jgi:hypothetical protein